LKAFLFKALDVELQAEFVDRIKGKHLFTFSIMKNK